VTRKYDINIKSSYKAVWWHMQRVTITIQLPASPVGQPAAPPTLA